MGVGSWHLYRSPTSGRPFLFVSVAHEVVFWWTCFVGQRGGFLWAKNFILGCVGVYSSWPKHKKSQKLGLDIFLRWYSVYSAYTNLADNQFSSYTWRHLAWPHMRNSRPHPADHKRWWSCPLQYLSKDGWKDLVWVASVSWCVYVYILCSSNPVNAYTLIVMCLELLKSF